MREFCILLFSSYESVGGWGWHFSNWPRQHVAEAGEVGLTKNGVEEANQGRFMVSRNTKKSLTNIWGQSSWLIWRVDFKNMKELKHCDDFLGRAKQGKKVLPNGQIGCPILLKSPSWHFNFQQISKIVAIGTLYVLRQQRSG